MKLKMNAFEDEHRLSVSDIDIWFTSIEHDGLVVHLLHRGEVIGRVHDGLVSEFLKAWRVAK
jgi:hypothetical protein